jgi:hypothetical protein
MPTERIAITHAERPGGLTLLFGENRITLYSSYDLSSSAPQYLEDAESLGLFLNEDEADFSAFDEGPALDAVLGKIVFGESWR